MTHRSYLPHLLVLGCTLTMATGCASFGSGKTGRATCKDGACRAHEEAADVRGQSPGQPVYGPHSAPVVASQPTEYGGPLIGSAPGYGQFAKSHAHHRDFTLTPGIRDHHFGYEGGYYAGSEGYYTAHKGRKVSDPYGNATHGCPECQYGHRCPNDGCKRCGLGCKGGIPHHHHTYRHDWPQNMVYPAEGMTGGQVQYPYYTLRGPTDFFMK